MIIQLLGANGAGKSTIVKGILATRPNTPVFILGRQRPDAIETDDVFVAGHYIGSACGGADTLPVREVQYVLQKLCALDGRPVLVEGPTGREPTLQGDVRTVHLRRDPEQNLEDWVKRNLEKGLKVNRMVMLRRIHAATKRCDNIAKEYVQRGLTVTTTSSREAAWETIRKLLRR